MDDSGAKRRMTRVLVVCTSTAAGLGLEAVVESHPDLEMAGLATDPGRALTLVDETRPDVIVAVVGGDASGAIRLCRGSRVPVLLLAAAADDITIRAAIRAGARGFLYESADRTHLASAIGWVAKGESVLDPRITARVMGWAVGSGREDGALLSSREAEVLRLASLGEANKQIANEMGLTENTVKTYLRRAFKKLDCHSRTAAAAALSRQGVQ